MSDSAIFLDRDGTLIEECHLLHRKRDVRLIDGAASVISNLIANNYKIIVVTNQSVVSRGICDEKKINSIHEHINLAFYKLTNKKLDAFYYCPHHPEATVIEYKMVCCCRKPRPGMLKKAQNDFNLNLETSFLIGDRITDVAAGRAAGCKTILFGQNPYAFERNVSPEKFDSGIQPDYRCKNWLEVEQNLLQVN